MNKTFGRVKGLLNEIADCPENIELLIDIASKNAKNNATVVKAAIHYDCLGDPNRYDNIKELILKLYDLEENNPGLAWEQTVTSTLIGTIGGAKAKKEKLSRIGKRMCDFRTKVSMELIEEIIRNKGYMKTLPHLIGALDDLVTRKNAEYLLDRIFNGKSSPEPGKTNIRTLELLGRMCGIIIRNRENDDELIYYTTEAVKKAFYAAKDNLLYVLTPVLEAWEYENHTPPIMFEYTLKSGKLGYGDQKLMDRFVNTCISQLGKSANMKEMPALIAWRRYLDEEKDNKILLIAPLINFILNSVDFNQRKATEELYKIIGKPYHDRFSVPSSLEDSHKLEIGKLDYQTLKSLPKAIAEGLNHGIIDHNDARKIINALIEGKNDMVHFVFFILDNLDENKYKTSDLLSLFDILMENKNTELGTSGSETMDELVFVCSLLKTKEKGIKYITWTMEKLVEEGKTDTASAQKLLNQINNKAKDYQGPDGKSFIRKRTREIKNKGTDKKIKNNS